MTRPNTILPELWQTLPEELQPRLLAWITSFEARIATLETQNAELKAQNAELKAQNAELKAQNAELKARLNQNSSNSSRPPSSDPPSFRYKPAPPRGPSSKAPGGQPGHDRNQRVRLQPDQILEVKPHHCRRCGESLQGEDSEPLIHQVFEVPKIRPHVVEHRLHRLTCPRCGTTTRGELAPEEQPAHGPRAQAICASLVGAGRMGKRVVSRTMMDLFGLPISPAMVCKLERHTAAALAPIHAEAIEAVRQHPTNVDETSWKQAGQKAWLWMATTGWLTVFLIATSRSRQALEELMGRSPPQVVTSDRYSAYSHLPPSLRQICWSHLRRDFQAMIDRDDSGRGIGQELLDLSDLLFAYWGEVRAGRWTRKKFVREMQPWLRDEVRRLLEKGRSCMSRRTAGTCREILKVEESLWTFQRVEGVEPTNNAGERTLRHAVYLRKTSHGTASRSGSDFVERVLTTVESCRSQKRNPLYFRIEAITAHRTQGKAPSLLPANS